jgi:hypothetical protein
VAVRHNACLMCREVDDGGIVKSGGLDNISMLLRSLFRARKQVHVEKSLSTIRGTPEDIGGQYATRCSIRNQCYSSLHEQYIQSTTVVTIISDSIILQISQAPVQASRGSIEPKGQYLSGIISEMGGNRLHLGMPPFVLVDQLFRFLHTGSGPGGVVLLASPEDVFQLFNEHEVVLSEFIETISKRGRRGCLDGR